MKKLALLAVPFLFMSSASAAEITSRLTDSVQLTVDGPSVQSIRTGSSYSMSGTNISAGTLGGLTNPTSSGPHTVNAGTYTQTTAGAYTEFSETAYVGDTNVTVGQNDLSTNGRFVDPNIYGNTTTVVGGTAGTLAGTLSPTGVATVTAGGPGTTALGQRTVELTVFQ